MWQSCIHACAAPQAFTVKRWRLPPKARESRVFERGRQDPLLGVGKEILRAFEGMKAATTIKGISQSFFTQKEALFAKKPSLHLPVFALHSPPPLILRSNLVMGSYSPPITFKAS
eukprot:TRINITY_DN6275_c0_g2_i1.p1 TRINITY_DN6275_c0_g2~~TRINITY_DN6275_c0_g2_i1.p1  ORF type:complete len:115 (-),score=5.15 TRINITY_DN6275_c0_g2_i1:33-377(-)